MATSSQVRGKSDEIDNGIEIIRRKMSDIKNAITVAKTKLSNYPTQFADHIAEVNGYAPDGPFETLAKDILAKQITEYQALESDIESAETFLAGLTEF